MSKFSYPRQFGSSYYNTLNIIKTIKNKNIIIIIIIILFLLPSVVG